MSTSDRPLTDQELQAVYDAAFERTFSDRPEVRRQGWHTIRMIDELRNLRTLTAELAPPGALVWDNGKWVVKRDT